MSDTRVRFLDRRVAAATSSVAPTASAPTASALRPFHVLAKPTGAICNLDCAYCFYLEKGQLYPGGRFRMTDDVMETYIGQLLAAHPPGPVTIAWQGGEPTLMGVSFFRRVVAVAERCKRPGQRLVHTLQTNGTLLDDEWGTFLAGNDVLVGLSIDGPPELHDAYRVDKRGRPTSARVLRGLSVLRRHDVAFNVLCTVHALNAASPVEVYRYLRDECGARYLQFIPIVEHRPTPGFPAAVSERSVTPEAWGAFLCDVFDEWLAGDVGSVFVIGFDAALASWMGLPPGVCVHAETCGDALAIEHNGDVYSCDHFVDPSHRLGNIADTPLSELVASPAQRRFGADKRDRLPAQCRQCDVRFACWGECPKLRFCSTADGEEGLSYLCAGYLSFFRHVDGPMRLMAALLRDGRPARDVVDVLAGAPRNAPCPCGSGRKAKHCHAR